MASRGVNKVILLGNLGQDPEIKYMMNGDAVCNISIATSEVWKDKNTGEQQEKTEWHRVVFYRQLAEIVGQYLKKGSKIYLEGRLQTRKWEKDGVTHYATEIIGDNMQMLGDKNGQDKTQDNRQPQTRPTSKPQSAHDGFDDDIPF